LKLKPLSIYERKENKVVKFLYRFIFTTANYSCLLLRRGLGTESETAGAGAAATEKFLAFLGLELEFELFCS
jgi:hypothetical protein